MIYTHVARKGVAGIASPLDLLDTSPEDLRAAVGAAEALAGVFQPPSRH
jgi:hypothetical protein